MASSSGGISYSCMRQPRLIKQLKSILSEYPDGGQILKELIQNAEDAEAREVKFLYDDRRINESRETEAHIFTKFFKGPALLVYNDAVFTDNDWEGIQMIYSSIKEEDPLKVGRFGLGFKSVFHITDYPCVISGAKLLMIDPSQQEHMVNATVDISNINNLESSGLNAKAFWNAFDDVFGFNKKCTDNGNFDGTIFRFPLREKPTELSDTLYDKDKVMDLFDVFSSEASSILLFLKSIECITVSTADSRKQSVEVTRVEINDNKGIVRKQRNEFKQKVTAAATFSEIYDGPDISSYFEVCIKSTHRKQTELSSWVVVNYFIGKSASQSFRTLIQDKSLGYSPYVGVAAPMSKDKTEFQGHVFCFLPLPNEGYSLTGLPVHLNGFFALSQSRHHIKWETEEQKGKSLDDKSILWNNSLIKEALPRAYKLLIKATIAIACQLGNSSQAVANVYQCLPVSANTTPRWKCLVEKVYYKLKKVPFLYCQQEKKWTTLDEACFATFIELPQSDQHVKAAVIICLHSIGKHYVDIPTDLFGALQQYFPDVEDLSPVALSEYLHQNQDYINLQSSDKINILAYLFSDGTDYEKVNGLFLLPLESGKWAQFDEDEESIYTCSPDVARLLPGLEDKLILTKLPEALNRHIDQICYNGDTQVQNMTGEQFYILVEEVMSRYLGSANRRLDSSTKLSVTWLNNLWRHIIKENEVSAFWSSTIVPVLKLGTWAAPRTVELKPLSDWLLVKSVKGKKLGDGVCRCLEVMGATALESLPDWIPQENVKPYFIWPTNKSIRAFLSKLSASTSGEKAIEMFNMKCSFEDRQELANYFSGNCDLLDQNCINLLQNLALFRNVKSKGDTGTFGSVYETEKYILGTESFPNRIPYPFSCLEINKSHEALVERLGGEKVSSEEMVLAVLTTCEKSKFNANVISEFMGYIITNFDRYKNNEDIVDSCRNIKFLKVDGTDERYKASDLFDPTDSKLQKLLHADSLLPNLGKHITSAQIDVLKSLGLRNHKSIDGTILIQVAKTLDTYSSRNSKDSTFQLKSEAFMETLNARPHLLEETISNGTNLAYYLNTLSCIPVHSSRPAGYPKCLDWFAHNQPLCKPCESKEVSLCLLVGSKMPMVKCNTVKLNEVFGWTSYPPVQVVINQLEMLRQRYSIRHQSELTASVKAIYEHLNNRRMELIHFKHYLTDEALILTEDGFVKPGAVIIKKESDSLDLRPHVFFLPQEFMHLKDFFEIIGCTIQQDRNVLLKTLHRIQDMHSIQQQDNLVKRDRRIVCNILESLAQNLETDDPLILEQNIPIMVHDENQKVLKLMPVSDCTYDDDPTCYYDTNEDIHLVHKMIPLSVVEALGVKSITTKAALDAEELGFEEWGQKEHLTTRIHALLRDGYTDGLSVPKELIQNADDAGASTIKFLYDERENIECRERVLSKGLKDFQGPAMWIYNDAKFTSKDLANITKLNAATKQSDLKKIGKFGLGFCSVYNLTDLPSFITGKDIVIFDPHERHLVSVLRQGGSGVKYKLPNKTLTSRYADQFKPYHGVFGCNIFGSDFNGYNGTLFRLPFRTELQAKESKIYKCSYPPEEVHKLLDMFVRSAANFLLFLQNVKEIEIYHLPKNATQATKPTLLHRVQRESLRFEQRNWIPVCDSVLSRIPLILQRNDTFLEIHRTTVNQQLNPAAKNIVPALKGLPSQSESEWIISWAKGQDKSLQLHNLLSSEGSVPLAAVACRRKDKCTMTPDTIKNSPTGFYSDGHLFCFLPLPITTNLLVHLNGCFAVTSDRRQLVTLTEDDKGSLRNAWNCALLEDATVKAMLHLLQGLSAAKLDDTYKYYQLWPTDCSEIALPFKVSFYRHLISTNATVFKGKVGWLSFQDVIFLDPILSKSEIGGLAFDLLSSRKDLRCGKSLIEMSDTVLEEIRRSNHDNLDYIQKAILTEKDVFEIFLDSIQDEFWADRKEDRNKMIICALKSSVSSVHDMIRKTACIPTEPAQNLRKPCDLVHPLSDLAVLFDTEDERFPLNTQQFRSNSILAKLVKLGMHSQELPLDLFVDRCKSIPVIAETCCECSKERCTHVLEYMSNEQSLKLLDENTEIVEYIQDIYMFPVLGKPRHWKFSWKGEEDTIDVISFHCIENCAKHKSKQKSIILSKSKVLYQQELSDYVGMTDCIVVEDIFNKVKARKGNMNRLLHALEIKADVNEISLTTLVNQTKMLVEQYMDKTEQFEELQKLHAKLFKQFDKWLKRESMSSDKRNLIIAELGKIRIVLVGDELIEKENAAFDVKEEVRPFMYKVSETERRNKGDVYKFLGVKELFSTEDILKVLEFLRETWAENLKENVLKIGAVLRCLEYTLEKSNLEYTGIPQYHSFIYAPDTNCQLFPTNELSLENEDQRFTVALKILHPSIAPLTGAKLGVKLKEVKCVEAISIGISFGQREELVNRIQGLLRAYPCDAGIMKELLQNADDAGATEVHIVKDYRNHPCEKLFRKECRPLQGPSLLVYNNSHFTKEDIEGIHNLGHGSKRFDPTKTGQYGVGFNAVYHLTDTPSFITVGPDANVTGHYIVLDPLLKHMPKATVAEPGQMCKLDDVKNNFPDHIIGFSFEDLLTGNTGTVFRLPLRQKESAISKEIISTNKMDSLLVSFREIMFQCVLFLKNVTCIKVSNITSGRLVEEYSVTAELSENAKSQKRLFQDNVCRITRNNKERKEHNLDEETFEVVYPMKVRDKSGHQKEWVIVQKFGFNGENCDELKSAMASGDLGLLPIGGVAIPIDADISKPEEETPNKAGFSFETVMQWASAFRTNKVPTTTKRNDENNLFAGKCFCFLPLPIDTGLPVHVNAHFALDHEARRELWKDGFRKEWNIRLIDSVIIPSWLSGLVYLQTCLKEAVDTADTWEIVNKCLERYHNLFPLEEKAQSQYWKHVVKQFYTHIAVNVKAAVFPVVLDRHNVIQPPNTDFEHDDARFCLLWTDIGRDFEMQSGVFNVIMTHLKYISDYQTNKEWTRLISTLLKAFGMKLIESPVKILGELEKAGIKSSMSIPENVWSFLKDQSGQSDNDGQTDSNIEVTVYKSIKNFLVFITYLTLDKDYVQKIEGLPLVLTADGILRVASRNNTLFSSRYFRLLPAAANSFVHEELRDILSDSRLFEMNILRKFKFEDFIDLLPSSISQNEFKVQFEVPLNTSGKYGSLSSEWICLLFDFLCAESQQAQPEAPSAASHYRYSSSGRTIELKRLLVCIEQMREWSFLPAVKMGVKTCLLPFTECTHLLHLTTVQKYDALGNALMKLNIPELDTKTLNNCSENSLILPAMLQCVASPDQPAKLLSCLVFHRRQGGNYATLSDSEAIEILGFFGRNLLLLTENADRDLIAQQLRQLPLYKTLQNTLKSIENDEDVFVLPRGMPSAGIEEWAENTNTTLLLEVESLQSIFKFLGLQNLDVESIYADKILPTLDEMPNHCWIMHIAFIKNMLGYLNCFTATQSKIISALTYVAFVNVSGLMKRVNQLYDHENNVFACMKAPTDFPPPKVFDYTWKSFLKLLGLICHVDDQHLLEFACEIQDRGKVNIDKKVINQSNILLDCFVKHGGTQWKVLSQIACIRFIVPYNVDTTQSSVCPQNNNASRLVCFQDSVSSDHAQICWSCVDLIPSWIYRALHPNVRMQLRMADAPPIEKVILHCQNVVDAFKPSIEAQTICAEFVTEQMTYFYEHFNKNMNCVSLMQQRLQHKPIIHLPDDNTLVTLSEIVIDMQSSQEIKPYLFKAPKFYGKYHSLFQKMGSKTDVMFSHYANILYKVKAKSGDEAMTPPERQIVKKVLSGLLDLRLDKQDNSISEIRTLYLPNKNLVLKDAVTLVFSNGPRLAYRIRDHLPGMDYFVGPAFLDLLVDTSFHTLFGKLPSHLKPKMLTDLVKETVRIDEDLMNANHYSFKALKLESFLHSRQFAISIGRLLKHQQFSIGTKQFDQSALENDITTRLKSIRVKETSSLVSVLTYQGNIIPGSEKDKDCHVKESEGRFTFYFKDTTDSDEIDVASIQHDLLYTIRRCVPDLNGDSVMHLTLLLRCIGHPEQLSLILDKQNITPFDFREDHDRDYFPEPGIRVEADMIPFLEQGIIPFKDYEFDSVAMELDDDVIDEELYQTFIYVRIIKEIPSTNISSDLGRVYAVRTGNPEIYTEVVPIYRLFRFVRRETDPGRELQRYDVEPIDSRPFDEHCRRIRNDLREAWKLPVADRKRIIRRLILKWHPDKNRGNEDYCKQVYQYIRIIISRLENGEEFVDSVAEEMTRGQSQFPPGTSAYYDNVSRRAQNIARAYYDNLDAYNRAERTSHYSHACAARSKVRDYVEANRWLRQAKNDYKAASVMLPIALDVEGFNWVCYTCHQSCEKALKAVLYSKDANNVPRGSRSHYLLLLTSDPDMREQASLLENRLGDNARMRYPDTVSRPQIPSDIFTRQDAEFALQIAKRMIELAEERVVDE